MKKIILILLLTLCHQSLCFAYNPQDLIRLQKTCSCPHCDLSNANLDNFKLGDSKTIDPKFFASKPGFVTCNLQQINFKGAHLTNAYFSSTDYAPGINNKVVTIRLDNANFEGADLTHAHFNQVQADKANFQSAIMNGVKIMKGSSFKDCNFKKVSMMHASITPPMGPCGAIFIGSDFSYANLAYSKIIADFTRVNFSYANLKNTTLLPCDNEPKQGYIGTNFYAANLVGAKYNEQDLTPDLLINAKLCKTKFSNIVNNRDCYPSN